MATNNTAVMVIIFFGVSLFFSSMACSWFLHEAYGVDLSPIDLPIFEPDNTYNFKTSNGSETGDIMITSGTWGHVSGVGRVADVSDSYFLFNNAGMPNAGAHTNSYKIGNPNQQDYSIVLSYSGARVQKVVVANDGFHVMDDLPFIPWFGSHEVYFFPYPNANQMTDVNIKTVFNPALASTQTTTKVLDFYLNGQILFSFDGSIGSQIEPILKAYYGGVGSENNVGLVLEYFSTSAAQAASNVSDIMSVINMGISYISSLLALLLWGLPAQYFPWELNLLLIRTQEFALGVGIWFWIRG